MTWNYAYTPSIWPSLITIVLLIALARYAWRRRSVPGALPFAVYCLICVPLLVGKTMEYLAVDLETKIEWYKFEALWYFPAGTAMTCFSLEYAQPGRSWPSPRTSRSPTTPSSAP